ncbi:hypothetical protein LXJ15735_28320 [Lacrimispora xylanolytica]
MSNPYVDSLIMTVIDNSISNNWEDAVLEWEVYDCEEDSLNETSCICGKENLKYLYTIRNKLNNKLLYPIGSSCIKKFGRQDLNSIVGIQKDMFGLLHAIDEGRFISLSSDLFTRKLLIDLFEKGVFDCEYNNFDGEKDFKFMLDMFNKRDKNSITPNQNRKIKAIIMNSIKPYLARELENKIH